MEAQALTEPPTPPLVRDSMENGLTPFEKIAVGLAAGAVGTIVMTIGQKAEMVATGRAPSPTPSKAVEEVTGIELSKDAEQRASTPIHFAYGTALGAGLAALHGVKEPLRTLGFFAGAYGSGQLLLTQLGLAKPPQEQEPVELATELGHHLVYAATAGLAYSALSTWLARIKTDDAQLWE